MLKVSIGGNVADTDLIHLLGLAPVEDGVTQAFCPADTLVHCLLSLVFLGNENRIVIRLDFREMAGVIPPNLAEPRLLILTVEQEIHDLHELLVVPFGILGKFL